MANKRDPYLTKTVTVGYSDRKVRKLVADGWEVVATRGGALGSAQTVTLRKPNPNYKGA
ncbi:hypothetical protein [Microbacterium phage MO526]|uniref:Uncharacterized protein n=2 Tax=Kozievirus TaxID=3152961 RepID=A0AAE8Y8Y8_9CAUD|nr:hypothetical protein QC998_gp62 [Microbacterium phage Kozie]UDL16258.1 hypothetical protein SEA_KOZIE_62 [Microbacterium phage Kozie]WQY99769.1 hypothetical protein [Microbacterium phage MO526]